MEQLKWIDQQLTEADLLAQSVVIFSHAPFLPKEGMHTLWNGGRVVELLESHSCVKAVICGHNHTGNYICRNGIHHITIKGMVESTANRFAVVSVSDDHLAVKGFGDQPDYDLSI